MKPDSYVLKSDKKELSPRVLALLSANSNVFGASVMAKAAAELAEKQEKEAAEKAFAYLQKFDNIVETEVAKLKALRAAEKKQRKIVKALGNALKEFANDGDAVAFVAVANSQGIH